MNLLHFRLMMYRSAVRVMSRQIHQEVGRIPALHMRPAGNSARTHLEFRKGIRGVLTLSPNWDPRAKP